MVITRTPFRVSFFGGGTDRYEWFSENGGGVISTTIDKYCYLTLRKLPPFFEHKHRIVYSRVENVTNIDEIQHPVVREVFRLFGIQEGKELHHDGDLPARSGLGSSSSFTVGLLMAIQALKGHFSSKSWLADMAIRVEREILNETVGYQDQIAAAYGGLNHIEFKKNGDYEVNPILINEDARNNLQSHLMLFFTGVGRFSSDVSKVQVQSMGQKKDDYANLTQLLNEAKTLFGRNEFNVAEFGSLLHEGWLIKRSLSEGITSNAIDGMYEKAMKAGAFGGKIIGAGGGGFLLVCAPPNKHKQIQDALYPNIYVPIKFENSGASVIHFDSSMSF